MKDVKILVMERADSTQNVMFKITFQFAHAALDLLEIHLVNALR
jgi:hypothetical protein